MNNNILRRGIMKVRDLMLPQPLSHSESHKRLYNEIIAGKPLMVARFGAVEIKMLLYSLLPPPPHLLSVKTLRLRSCQ